MSDKATKRKERDERIYWAVRGERRSQRDVAKEFELTQPRVCQIVRDVGARLDQTMPGLSERLAEAVYLTRVAEERVASGALFPEDATLAAEASADALARLARSLLLPAGPSASAAPCASNSSATACPR